MIVCRNLTHMKKIHGFMFPDPDCIIEVEELLDYLAQKVIISILN